MTDPNIFIILTLATCVLLLALVCWFACITITHCQRLLCSVMGVYEDDPPVILGRHTMESAKLAAKHGLSYEIQREITESLAREYAAAESARDTP